MKAIDSCVTCHGTGYVHHGSAPGPFLTVKCLCVHVRKHYTRYRALGYCASDALRSAHIVVRFEDEGGSRDGGDYDGLVKLECDLEYEPYDHGDDTPAQRKVTNDRIEHEGHWILVSYWRANDSDPWEQADAIGGFIGDDWRDSGYDVDLMASALDCLDAERERIATEDAAENA